MEIQQTEKYSQYIISLGWKSTIIDDVYIYHRYFPIMGGLGKIQRSNTLPDLSKLILFLIKEKIKTLAIEPDEKFDQKELNNYIFELKKLNYRINSSPFIPTKTYRINLTPNEDEIFKNFSEAKRRAVRKAIKNGVTVTESENIRDLIKIKNKSGGPFGFITTHGLDKLWPIMAPENAGVILAYDQNQQLLGGILLLFHDQMAYYWISGTIKYGKKLFAPTLLVWEALRLAKKRGMKSFDFVGIWDERLPRENKTWLGFTKFKEGFGGQTVYYPISF